VYNIRIQNDNNPPLYYTILHFWIWIFGDSEFAARVPSALFGSFSIIAIYAVGRFLFNKNVGLIAAFILATSVFHIRYSQEARAYSLLAFLTLVSFYYYLKIESSDRRLYVLGYLLSSILMLYTHYYGLLILAAQNIFFFSNYFKNHNLGALTLKKWRTSQIILGVLFLPGFILLVKHAVAIQGGFWLPEPTLLGILTLLGRYSGSVSLFLLLLIFSLLSIIGLRQIKDKIGLKQRLKPILEYSEKLSLSNSNRVYLLLLWLFIPIVLPYLVSLISTPILLYRYTIGCSLAFYLLAARGIDYIAIRKIILLIAALILVLSYFRIETYHKSVNKYQWRETIGFIEDNASVGDYVAVYPIFEIESAHYYKKRDDMHLYSLTNEFLLQADIGNKNLWVVLASHRNTEKGRIEQVLKRRYNFLSQKKYKSLNIYKYEKKGSR